MGYKFRIEYKTGASNRVADALSQRDMEGGPAETNVAGDPTEDGQFLVTVAQPVPEILDVLRLEAESADDLVELRLKLESGSGDLDVSISDGLLYYKRRIYVSKDSAVKEKLHEFHAAHLEENEKGDQAVRGVVL